MWHYFPSVLQVSLGYVIRHTLLRDVTFRLSCRSRWDMLCVIRRYVTLFSVSPAGLVGIEDPVRDEVPDVSVLHHCDGCDCISKLMPEICWWLALFCLVAKCLGIAKVEERHWFFSKNISQCFSQNISANWISANCNPSSDSCSASIVLSPWAHYLSCIIPEHRWRAYVPITRLSFWTLPLFVDSYTHINILLRFLCLSILFPLPLRTSSPHLINFLFHGPAYVPMICLSSRSYSTLVHLHLWDQSVLAPLASTPNAMPVILSLSDLVCCLFWVSASLSLTEIRSTRSSSQLH